MPGRSHQRVLVADDQADVRAALRLLCSLGPEMQRDLAVHDEARRALRYANCDHLPPALLRAGGRVRRDRERESRPGEGSR